MYLRLERFNYYKVVGICIAIGGVFVIVGAPLLLGEAHARTTIAGTLYFLANNVNYSIYLLIIKYIKFPPISTTALQFLAAAPFFAFIAPFFTSPVAVADWPPIVWIS